VRKGTATESAIKSEAKSATKSATMSGTELDSQMTGPRNELSLRQLRRKYKNTIFFQGSPYKREVALTFDDAPDPRFTQQILDVLRQYNVKATFFVVGSRAVKYPWIVRRIVTDGHVVGNHSFSHANLKKLRDKKFRWEILHTNEVLQTLVGYDPNLVRPPYGNIREKQLMWLRNKKFKVVNWSSDSLDWKNLEADQVYANIMKNVEPGAIILQHAGGGDGEKLKGTIEALPKIINELRARGYKIVTLPELLDLPKSRQSTGK
jgi:peptidoglycan/xylan/chitin deacetylase (PgdA/CDA1 family)